MAWPQRFDPSDRNPITQFRSVLNRTFQREYVGYQRKSSAEPNGK